MQWPGESLTATEGPSQQVCPGAVLPGRQGVVGHIGKVQEREEVLGANCAEALGEVGVDPMGKGRIGLAGDHQPGQLF